MALSGRAGCSPARGADADGADLSSGPRIQQNRSPRPGGDDRRAHRRKRDWSRQRRSKGEVGERDCKPTWPDRCGRPPQQRRDRLSERRGKRCGGERSPHKGGNSKKGWKGGGSHKDGGPVAIQRRVPRDAEPGAAAPKSGTARHPRPERCPAGTWPAGAKSKSPPGRGHSERGKHPSRQRGQDVVYVQSHHAGPARRPRSWSETQNDAQAALRSEGRALPPAPQQPGQSRMPSRSHQVRLQKSLRFGRASSQPSGVGNTQIEEGGHFRIVGQQGHERSPRKLRVSQDQGRLQEQRAFYRVTEQRCDVCKRSPSPRPLRAPLRERLGLSRSPRRRSSDLRRSSRAYKSPRQTEEFEMVGRRRARTHSRPLASISWADWNPNWRRGRSQLGEERRALMRQPANWGIRATRLDRVLHNAAMEVIQNSLH